MNGERRESLSALVIFNDHFGHLALTAHHLSLLTRLYPLIYISTHHLKARLSHLYILIPELGLLLPPS